MELVHALDTLNLQGKRFTFYNLPFVVFEPFCLAHLYELALADKKVTQMFKSRQSRG